MIFVYSYNTLKSKLISILYCFSLERHCVVQNFAEQILQIL